MARTNAAGADAGTSKVTKPTRVAAAPRARRPARRTAAPLPEPRSTAAPSPPASEAAPENSWQTTLESVNGQNTLGTFRPRDLVKTAGAVAFNAARHPVAVVRTSLGFLGDLGKAFSGGAQRAPEPGDKRFADPAWTENKLYRILLQGYLAGFDSLKSYAATAGLEAKEAERAGFLLSQVGNAFAPTNFLAGNPAALKRVIDTGGKSLVRGVSNLLDDISKGRPLPAQVDERPFKVGQNLAATPGHVVLRTELFELVQYSPQTEQVRQRPILVVPSIVNKYYAADLAPGRSMFEYFVKGGMTLFTMVWRNPRAEHKDWGMAEYQDAIDMAIDAVRDIRAVDDVNLWVICGAGPVVTSVAGYYAAMQTPKINSLMLVVSPLDTSSLSQVPVIGGLMDPKLTKLTKRLPKKGGMSTKEFTLMFAMLRPNELIWNNWVNNYLMGNDPPAFDVLYWNADGTGMTAKYQKEFGEMVSSNAFTTPGAMTMRGKPVAALDELAIDSYVIGAATDHIVVWPAVYRSAQVLGKRSEFVLSSSGHIQTIICPPGNPKSHYFTNPAKPGTADEWMAGAVKQQGTWWDHLMNWTTARAGPMVAAPEKVGNRKHGPICKAPGTYVMERR